MNRFFRLRSLSRALAVLTALACIAVIAVPAVRPARGEGAVKLAIVAPENSGNVSQAILAQIGQAMYDGVAATGRYEVRGNGTLKVTPAIGTGDVLSAALAAAENAGADQVLVSDVVQVASGKVLYRMSIYKVNPVTFGRSQVFQQPFPPSNPRVFSSQFGSDLAALEAPRTNTGTIYSVTQGIITDTGSAEGFHLGQRFNVVRGGKKVAEAQIVTITEINASVEILNPSAGYKADVGDLLISQEPGPAIPVSNSGGGSNTALGFIGVLAGVAAAVLAIGHHGSGATLLCPPPTPTGPGCATSMPTTGATFVVTETNQTGAPLMPVFTFTFSQPVLNASTFDFADTTNVYVQDQINGSPPGAPMPIAGLGGANASFDASGTVLTVTVTGSLSSNNAYYIVFTNNIHSTTGSTLVFTTIRYPLSGFLSHATRPLTGGAPPNPVSPGNGANGGNNGNGGKGPQPHQPPGNGPHPGH